MIEAEQPYRDATFLQAPAPLPESYLPSMALCQPADVMLSHGKPTTNRYITRAPSARDGEVAGGREGRSFSGELSTSGAGQAPAQAGAIRVQHQVTHPVGHRCSSRQPIPSSR